MNETEGIIVGTMEQTNGSAYVYQIVVDGVVRYIGKGTGKRMFHHVSIARHLSAKRANGQKVRGSLFYNKLAKAISSDCIIEPSVVAENLSEESAYERERKEIDSYPEDQLWNVFSGGRGSTREDCLRAWNDTGRRLRHNETMAAFLARPDVRERISEGTKAGLSRPGVLEARHQSQIIAAQNPETQAKKRATMKALWEDPAHRARYWAARVGNTRQKMSDSAKKRGISPERRAKMVASIKRRLTEPDMIEKWRQRAIEVSSRPEVKKAQSEAAKRMWGDPIRKAQLLEARRVARDQRQKALR